ncbi:Leucine carboxyl methyltransferase 2 [Theileria orientalis]|uniref:[phosphatase 2A protein]-leucine-carboxy methyltransferase n=1 Tax=Theileria orientalis TaxID=68886 RepID=A0A976SJY4_THEOR|nr:Leucine carboxyl methyltransferase 2 [Theileria orientalis]
MGFLDIKKSAKTAILTKRSSKDLGYFEDKYLDFFSTKSTSPSCINLATYLRVSSLKSCFEEFFSYFKNEKAQFLSLGTGLDTTPYHLLETYDNVVCFDHDFEETMKSKAQIMKKNKKFFELLPDLRDSGDYVTSERYKMVPFDLNDFDKLSVLLDSGISNTLPTLILSDYCVNYLKSVSSNRLTKTNETNEFENNIENFTQMDLLDLYCHLFFLGFAYKNFRDPSFFDFLFHEITNVDKYMVSLHNEPLSLGAMSGEMDGFIKYYTELSDTPIDCVTF